MRKKIKTIGSNSIDAQVVFLAQDTALYYKTKLCVLYIELI